MLRKRRTRGSIWWVVPLALTTGCAGNGPPSAQSAAAASFASPTECASCHPRQYAEWQGAMMAYGEVSPVFNALEAAGNALTGGAFAADGAHPLFCQRCHNPIDVARHEFPSYAATGGHPSRDFADAVGIRGLSCDLCHQVAHADLSGSLLGDGIANVAFVMTPGTLKYGPFTQPRPTAYHTSTASDYLRSAQFCGSCHDVRPAGPDIVTGEPFLRLENAFTEWQSGPYATTNNPYGRVITCQDCHMSAYPYAPAGTYFQDAAAAVAGLPQRSVVTHYFTGVDVALIDFPGQSDTATDGHGVPIGQMSRRADLLRAACSLGIEAPSTVAADDTLPITVAVTNVGAGHRVPTGFSQERQMWIELTVTGADGNAIYRSGYLTDQAHPETGEVKPDGNLDDEDLEDLAGSIDPATLEFHGEPGPDADQRPAVNLGLVNFGNQFQRVSGSQEDEVFVPFIANHMDNSHSVPPLESVRVEYDVPLPAALVGPVTISARLRFRTFPPRFLRCLAQARPDLVSEQTVDRSHVIDMAAAEASVNVP